MSAACLRLCGAMALVVGLLAFAHGAENRSALPIQIKSNQLLADSTRKTATFTGNVVARQGDLTIYGDKLVISYAESEQEVRQAELFGKVRIVQGDRIGQSGHAIYDAQKGTIVLDQTPTVSQGENVITGETITYYVDEGRSVVSGGSGGRVDAIIHPRGKKAGSSARP